MSDDVLADLQTSRTWINYGPARPWEMIIGQHLATEEQSRRELGLLYERGFRGLVTNTMAYGCEAAPRVAKESGSTT